MTTAATRSRARKAKALMPRGQHLIDQGADWLILSARCASVPEPKFWAGGELAARTRLAVPAECDWDENYERADVGGGYHWDWYRAALLADELARVPVVTVPAAPVTTPGTPPVDDDPELTDRVNALWGTAAEKGLTDVPGPEEGAVSSPAPSTDIPPGGAPGPGTPTDDPALD